MNRMKELSEANNNPSLMPDKVSYASLIKAITEEGRYDSCWEIESIIDMMESSSQPSLQPDSKIYTLALDGFFKSSDITAPSKGESLVDRLRERVVRGVSSAKPDVYMYAILIKLHSNVGDVRKSDSVLSRMIREYKNGNLACRPNETVYITAMGSWKRSKRSDAFDGAFRLFNDMKMQYKEGNLQCKPTLMTFGQLMVILANSEKPSKQMIGFKLLRSMEEFGLEADRPVLNWYLRVCASVCGGSEERQNSLHSAFEVFESLRSSRMEANSNSFISMVHACANLLDDPKERETQILDVFTKCTEDGYVNRKFLLALQRFLPRERFSEIVPLGPMSRIDMGAIPLLWKLNYVLNEPDK